MSEVVECISWIVQKTCWSFWVFMKFLFLRFLDLLGLIFNILACATIVRLPSMIRHFQDMDMVTWRYAGLIQLLIFISDIPVMIACLFLTFTVYRLFPLREELKEKNCKWDWEGQKDIYYAGCKPRGIILKHFSLLFFDALFVPAGLVCLLSWRCVMFVEAIKKAEDSWKRRVECFKQFGLLLLDIPCIILGIICACTWRLPLYIYRFKNLDDTSWDWDWEHKWHAFLEFFYLLVDIPCIICLCISLCTWRLPFLIHDLKKINLNDDDWEWKARKIFLIQFGLIFVDIPCIICFIFVFSTIWRFPFLVQDCKRAVRKKSGKQWRIRLAVCKQYGMFFVDVGCFLLALILAVTLWRLYPLQRDIKKYINRKYEITSKDSDVDATGDKCKKNVVEESESPDVTQAVGFDDSASKDDRKEAVGIEKEAEEEEKQEAREEFDRIVDNPCHEENSLSNVYIQESSKATVDSSPVKKIEIGWKIRKSICLHFLMLLADIPAFGLLCLLIATVIRLPTVLSTFLQSGDFYMEFAITVYHQTSILFVDLFFLLLFIVLMILRPVTSWVCVLEDEDHMKYRLLRHHMQWVPDAVAKRHEVYTELDELVTVNLKMFASPASFQISVKKILTPYLKNLRKVKDKMAGLELDPDYLHLLDSVLWWEDKRIDKICRQYICEYNYLQRPDCNIRRDNLWKLNREMRHFDAKVSEQYRELEKFAPIKVPLWTVATGLSTRSRKETQMVLIKCLPRGDVFLIFVAILCCLPLYRAPILIKKLSKRWYNRAEIILDTVKQYSLDLLTLLRILLVIMFIYRGPALIADISIDIIEKRSWKAVRRTAKRYPMLLVEDFVNLCSTLLSWKTPRFIFTALLFGILMPADMLLTAAKFCTGNKRSAYVITVALYVIFMSFPFIMSFFLGKKLLEVGVGWVSIPVTCVYVALLLLMLALMVRAFVKNRRDLIMVPKQPDYVHWSWFNIHVVIMEALELLQILALVFSLPGIPIYGGKVLNEVSSYLLLSFISFEFKLWAAFCLFVIWFFLCGAPIIFEQILEDLKEGMCAQHMGWRMAISLFANTLFVSMLESFASCFSCSYTKCPSSINYKLLPSNSTCFKAYLSEETSYECWAGDHRVIAFFGLFAFLWYTTTSFMASIQYGDPGTKQQDIDFSPAYNLIANFFKAIMVISAVNITTNNNAVLGILIAGNFLLILHTLLFKKIFKYAPTNSRSFIVWRVASFFSGLIAAVVVVVAFALNKPGNKIPLIIFGAGTLASLVIALIVSILLRVPGKLDETRERFKKRLLALEKRLVNEKMVLTSWKNQQKSWRRLLQKVREARLDDHFYEESDWKTLKTRETEPIVEVPSSETSLNFNEALQNDALLTVAEDRSGWSGTERQSTEDVEAGKPTQDAEQEQIPETEQKHFPETEQEHFSEAEQEHFSETDQEHSSEAKEEHFSETAAVNFETPPPPSYGSIDTGTTDFIVSARPEAKSNEQITVSPCDRPVMSLQRNGVNLLLILEQCIQYKAYAYSFLAQREMWLLSVTASNWTGLEHCLQVLESSLDQSFERPSRLDVSLGQKSIPTDRLEDDPRDQEEPPSYTPESRDPEVIAAKSASLRSDALNDVSSIEEHGEHWRELMDKVLPTLPIIKSWRFENGHFDIVLKRAATGTIKDIGPKGIKLARGASFKLGKVTKGYLNENVISFVRGCEPKASKGPVAVTVSDLRFLWKKETWYLESQGKSVKYDVALDCMKEIEWR